MSLKTVIVTPALLLIFALLIFGGRIVMARGAVQSAASEAARALSISRIAAIGVEQARSTATSTLANSKVTCSSTTIDVDHAAFGLPMGQPGQVAVSVTCVVPLSDITLPGLPGSMTMSATGRSVIDAYRER